MKYIKRHLPTSVKYKALDALKKGIMPVEKIAKLFCIDRSTLYRWKMKCSKNELERKQNPLSGAQPKITGNAAIKLIAILKKPAKLFGYDNDLWTTKRIEQTLKKELRIKASRMAIHRFLTKIDFTYKKPESRYLEKNKEKQEIWEKYTVKQIKKTIKTHNAILYFEDESNISLSPVIGKTWSPKGEKTILETTSNRGSLSVISAISKSGHLMFNVHDNNKRFSAKDIINFLTQMLAYHKRRHLVVILDQAACHTAKSVKEFVAKNKRLHIFYLPPKTPELNADEKIWHYLKHHELKSHKAQNIKALKKLTVLKMKKLSKNTKKVIGLYKRSDAYFLFK